MRPLEEIKQDPRRWALGVREYHMFYIAMAVFALYIVLVQLGLRRATARRAKAEDIHKI